MRIKLNLGQSLIVTMLHQNASNICICDGFILELSLLEVAITLLVRFRYNFAYGCVAVHRLYLSFHHKAGQFHWSTNQANKLEVQNPVSVEYLPFYSFFCYCSKTLFYILFSYCSKTIMSFCNMFEKDENMISKNVNGSKPCII